jgi:L-ribulose-5-phosphate 3-epimerase
MKLSLAGWSLNKLFRAPTNPLKLVDFPKYTKETFGIDAVELNNIYFDSTDAGYLDTIRASADKAGSKLLNIAVDEAGDLCHTDVVGRHIAIANYARWIPVAKYLGCSAIRANSGGRNVTDRAVALDCCIDSFRRLCDVGCTWGVRVMVENHWGMSSDPDVMARICDAVDRSHGKGVMHTLADWGNWDDATDRYAAIAKVMPYAHAVHAKVNDIDENLNHPRFDHARCLQISRQAGYDGYLGIEYEGKDDPVIGIARGVKTAPQHLESPPPPLNWRVGSGRAINA